MPCGVDLPATLPCVYACVCVSARVYMCVRACVHPPKVLGPTQDKPSQANPPRLRSSGGTPPEVCTLVFAENIRVLFDLHEFGGHGPDLVDSLFGGSRIDPGACLQVCEVWGWGVVSWTRSLATAVSILPYVWKCVRCRFGV